MSLTVNCSQCGRAYRVEESALGRRATCQACHAQFTIARSSAPPASGAPSSATPPRAVAVQPAVVEPAAIEALLQEAIHPTAGTVGQARAIPWASGQKRWFVPPWRRARQLSFQHGPSTADRCCVVAGIISAALATILLLLPMPGRAFGILVFGAFTPHVAIGLGIAAALLMLYGLRRRMQVAAAVAGGTCLVLLVLVMATHRATSNLIVARQKASLDGGRDPYSVWHWNWEEQIPSESERSLADEEPEEILSAEDNPSPWVKAGVVKTRGQPALEHRKKLLDAKVAYMHLLKGVNNAKDYLDKLPQINAAEHTIKTLTRGKVTLETHFADQSVARDLRQQENTIAAIDRVNDELWLEIEAMLLESGEKTLHADVQKRNQRPAKKR